MSNRKACNLQIVDYITSMINAYPDLRFNQILATLDINVSDGSLLKDLFHEEPEITLKRVKETFDKIQNF